MASFKLFAVMAILALAGSAAAARKRVTKKDVGFPSVADALIAGNYTALLDAVQLADLTDLFGPEFEGTVLAPVNKAFDQLIEEVTPLGLEGALEDPAIVAQVLAYHVINGTAIKAADLVDGAEVQTLAGVPLTVQLVDGKAYFVDVNGRRALVGKPDIAAGNAIVHAINRVLLPVPLPGAGANSTETAETTPEGTETTAPEGTEVAAPTGAASGLMASAAAVAASLVAAAFLA